MILVRFFAGLRDITGTGELQVRCRGDLTVEQLFDRLLDDHPGLARFRPALLAAVNEEYAEWHRGLRDGDEVAFFPPVSGGCQAARGDGRG